MHISWRVDGEIDYNSLGDVMNFIFPLIIIIVVFYIFSKNRKQRSGLYEKVASELGFTVNVSPNGMVEMSGTRNNRNFNLEFTSKGRNLGPIMNVVMEADHPFSFTLKPEASFSGFAPGHRITQDFEVGDAEFDRAFEVRTHETRENMTLFSDPAFRSLAMQIGTPTLIHLVAERERIVFREFVTEADVLGAYVRQLLDNLVELGMLLAENRMISEIESANTDDEGARSVDAPTEPNPADFGAADEAQAYVESARFDPVTADPVQGDPADPEPTHPEPEAIESSASTDDSRDKSDKATDEPDEATGAAEAPTVDAKSTVLPDPNASTPSGEGDDVGVLLERVDSGTLSAEQCGAKIAESGSEAIAETVRQLSDYSHREAAKQVLLAMDVDRAIPVLVSEMKQYSLAYEIKLLLREYSDAGGKRLLEEVGGNYDEETLKTIFDVIGELKVDGAVEKLAQFLGNESFSLRYAAENALRRLGVDYDELSRLKREAE
jgi:hypothetical protein